MLLTRMARWAVAALFGFALAGCGTASEPMSLDTPVEIVAAPEPIVAEPIAARTARMPNSIRNGAAQLAVQRVESDVSRDEVAAVIQAMLSEQAVCMPWPALWAENLSSQRIIVRFDLMARDWGEEAAAAAEGRMQEFVELGFLTAREQPRLGPRVVEFALTPSGQTSLRGRMTSGSRPAFCGSTERRVVDIVSMQWGEFPCGSLHVRFSHVADRWPSWARTEAARARVGAVSATGEVAFGEVTLSRRWRLPSSLRPGEPNGELRSMCYGADGEVEGNDFSLAASAE